MLALYTCASTCGVILELVPDAGSKCFIYSLRKFVSCRGCSGRILLIMGQFLLCQKRKNLQQIEILNGIQFMNGFRQQLVSIVKRYLKDTVGKACLNFH